MADYAPKLPLPTYTNEGRRSLPMYDVRCTMYDLAKPWTQLRMIRAPFKPTTLYDLAKPWTQLRTIRHLSNYYLA